MDFENKIYEGIHYSRFLASFINGGGVYQPYNRGRDFWFKFENWLRQLQINGKAIPEDTIREIRLVSENGKMELEENAKVFLLRNKK